MKIARFWRQSHLPFMGLLLVFSVTTNVEARDLTDMFGRHFCAWEGPSGGRSEERGKTLDSKEILSYKRTLN